MKRWRIVMLVGLLLQLAFPLTVHAVGENAGNYSVQPILPENQRDEGRTFFDLRVAPGDNQTIQVQINNFSDKEQTYHINVNTAQTNGNVIIDYGETELPEDSIVKHPISELVSYPKEVQIPAQKAGIVPIDIEVPDESFDGILLGGIQVKKDFSEEKAEHEGQFFSEYAYVIGLMLTENDKEIIPDLKLNEVKTEVITNNAGVVVVMENPEPINIKDVDIEANIYQEGEQEPVMTRSIEKGGIAPESVFAMNIFNGEPGNTKPLKAGDYRIELAAVDENGREWNFSEEFTITEKQAEAVNHEVFTVINNTNPWLYAALGVLAAIVVSGGIYFYISKNKKQLKVT